MNFPRPPGFGIYCNKKAPVGAVKKSGMPQQQYTYPRIGYVPHRLPGAANPPVFTCPFAFYDRI